MNCTQFTNRYSYKAKVDAIGEAVFGKWFKSYDTNCDALNLTLTLLNEYQETIK